MLFLIVSPIYTRNILHTSFRQYQLKNTDQATGFFASLTSMVSLKIVLCIVNDFKLGWSPTSSSYFPIIADYFVMDPLSVGSDGY